MTPLLEQFISETRDLLQGISEQLLEVEKSDDKKTTLDELFRVVHTLKGNTGLFEFPDLTRVLHAGEDVMSEARENPALWDQALTDYLFDAMDFVAQFCDSIEETDGNPVSDSALANTLAANLRAYLESSSQETDAAASEPEDKPATKKAASKTTAKKTTAKKKTAAKKTTTPKATEKKATEKKATEKKTTSTTKKAPAKRKTTRKTAAKRPELATGLKPLDEALFSVDQAARLSAWLQCVGHEEVVFVEYTPLTECFFQGDDPLHSAISTPGVLWGDIDCPCVETPLADLDPYQCVTKLRFISSASIEEVEEHFRYVPDQIKVQEIAVATLLAPLGEEQNDALAEEALTALCKAIEAQDHAAVERDIDAALSLMNVDLAVANVLTDMQRLLTHAGIDTAIQQLGLVTLAHYLCYELHAEPFAFTEVAAPEAPVSVSDDAISGEAEQSADQSSNSDSDDGRENTDDASDDQPLAAAGLEEDDLEAMEHILQIQRRILRMDSDDPWASGRVDAVINVLINCYDNLELADARQQLDDVIESARSGDIESLVEWIEGQLSYVPPDLDVSVADDDDEDVDNERDDDVDEDGDSEELESDQASDQKSNKEDAPASSDTKTEPKAATSAPASSASKPVSKPATKPATTAKEPESKSTPSITASRSVKVDQEKIDRLMNLIGEMIVAKNALPFLAKRAEEQHGLREMAREIKEQYAVVNRIAEEMQDSIMQIRMMPFSFISMRFPRLVRDISRRLEKEVQLIIEGEDTEADKNIIESLAEPLIHIVRNSLDHGIEMPAVREKAGKPAAGTLTIRASQEADRVMIEINDDGKGIDPEVIKAKALEKGLIDEATQQRLTDREAVNLVLLPGFSTAEEVSDLSGRGVGMDAVRSAVEKVNGTMALDSETGKGTRIRISLPMSIAVTRVMIVESDKQLMGIPMDQVLETVRVPRSEIYTVKHVQTTVLRDRIVPLKSLNQLLALPSPQTINEEDEHAVLVARVGNDVIGLIVDDFRGSVDIIQKPMSGVLSGIQAYSGAALIGDGSVLMVLNLKEVL